MPKSTKNTIQPRKSEIALNKIKNTTRKSEELPREETEQNRNRKRSFEFIIENKSEETLRTDSKNPKSEIIFDKVIDTKKEKIENKEIIPIVALKETLKKDIVNIEKTTKTFDSPTSSITKNLETFLNLQEENKSTIFKITKLEEEKTTDSDSEEDLDYPTVFSKTTERKKYLEENYSFENITASSKIEMTTLSAEKSKTKINPYGYALTTTFEEGIKGFDKLENYCEKERKDEIVDSLPKSQIIDIDTFEKESKLFFHFSRKIGDDPKKVQKLSIRKTRLIVFYNDDFFTSMSDIDDETVKSLKKGDIELLELSLQYFLLYHIPPVIAYNFMVEGANLEFDDNYVEKGGKLFQIVDGIEFRVPSLVNYTKLAKEFSTFLREAFPDIKLESFSAWLNLTALSKNCNRLYFSKNHNLSIDQFTTIFGFLNLTGDFGRSTNRHKMTIARISRAFAEETSIFLKRHPSKAKMTKLGNIGFPNGYMLLERDELPNAVLFLNELKKWEESWKEKSTGGRFHQNAFQYLRIVHNMAIIMGKFGYIMDEGKMNSDLRDQFSEELEAQKTLIDTLEKEEKEKKEKNEKKAKEKNEKNEKNKKYQETSGGASANANQGFSVSKGFSFSGFNLGAASNSRNVEMETESNFESNDK